MSAPPQRSGTGGSVRATSRTIRGQLDMTFDVMPRHMGTVRRVVREHLRWWCVSEEATERMISALNELLTNVLQHTEPDGNGRRITDLLVQQVPGGLTAVVRDRDRRKPIQVKATPADESGRGLRLVRAMVDDANVSVTGAGKDVWVFICDDSMDAEAPTAQGSATSGGAAGGVRLKADDLEGTP